MSGTAHDVPGGVVFDCDGVLADTTQCWDEAFTGAARELGVLLDQARLAELRGAALVTAAERIAQWSPRSLPHLPVLQVLHRRLEAAIAASDVMPIDGVHELLGELHGTVRIGVASNSPTAMLQRLLARLGIAGYFAAVIGAEDVARPKPAPDPYLAACAALRIDPRRSFAIEDSEVGARSAAAAGLTVIELATSPPPRPGPAPAPAPAPASAPGPAPTSGRTPGRALRVASLADRRIPLLVSGRLRKHLPHL